MFLLSAITAGASLGGMIGGQLQPSLVLLSPLEPRSERWPVPVSVWRLAPLNWRRSTETDAARICPPVSQGAVNTDRPQRAGKELVP